MKKFLLKCILLAVILVVPIAAVNTIDWVLRSQISFELPKDKTVLFIGHSQIECGVNDNLIPGAFNNAKSADGFQNVFPRMRKFLDANPQINTVFIAVAPFNLRENIDTRDVSGDRAIPLQLNLPFYDWDELAEAYSWRTIVRMFTDVRSFERAIERILDGRSTKLEELGGFIDGGDTNDGLLRETKNDGKLGSKRLPRSGKGRGNAQTIKHLRKIVEFVRARDVRIIFLNPPIYHADELFDVPYFENLLKENFPDVEFWDYGNYPIPENCFKDINHLNGKGAEIFSKELARRMKEEGIIDDSEWERPTPAN